MRKILVILSAVASSLVGATCDDNKSQIEGGCWTCIERNLDVDCSLASGMHEMPILVWFDGPVVLRVWVTCSVGWWSSPCWWLLISQLCCCRRCRWRIPWLHNYSITCSSPLLLLHGLHSPSLLMPILLFGPAVLALLPWACLKIDLQRTKIMRTDFQSW